MPNGTAQTAMSVTVAGRAAAGDPAPLADPRDGHDDAGDDAQRVGPQRERAELPDALRGAGDGGEAPSCSRHSRARPDRPRGGTPPAASSADTARRRRRRRSSSARDEGRADDDAVGEGGDLGGLGAGRTPEPDADRQVGVRRGCGRPASAAPRDGGAGAGHAHRRGGVDEAAAGRGGRRRAAASVEDGATRKTRSRPSRSAAASQPRRRPRRGSGRG